MREYRFSELKPGLVEEFQVTVTAEMMRKFREISGDCNPLHTDPDFANQRKFPGIVVYGLLTTSFYSTLAGVYLPGKFCLLHGVAVEFARPAYVGDQLTVRGEVTYLNESCRQAQISALINSQDGLRISRAKITVGVHES